MDFELTEPQRALQRLVRDFMEREVAPRLFELEEREEFPLDIVRRLGELGLLGLPFPEEYGGGGADNLTYVVALEEMGRVDSSVAITVEDTVSLAGYPLHHFGTEEQKRRWLVPLAQGRILGAFALTEPGAGSDAGAITTSAAPRGGFWVLNGTKAFITNSGTPMTGFIAVAAVTGTRDGKKEISVILVPRDTPGLTVAKHYQKMGWRMSDTHELSFDDCRVPEANLLGQRGAGLRQLLATLDHGRVAVAALGVGLAQGCLEHSLKYAQERVQFGRPVAEFQAIQFKLAEMALNVELARLMTHKAATIQDRGQPFGKEAAMAKLFASENAVRASQEAVQIHGGYGLMREHPVSRFYRDAKYLTIGEGTSEIMYLVIARQLGVRGGG